MPVILDDFEAHRQKDLPPIYPACVAKLVPPKDRLNIPAAKKALDEEWDKLKRAGKNGCWNEAIVRERFEVERDARASRETVHFGHVHELCYLKNRELPEADPRRKYKGRAVFLGDQVKDQDGNVALFQELGSAPATMSASKIADYHGLLPGNVLMTAGVTSAYCQAKITGTKTWVELPPGRWRDSWFKSTLRGAERQPKYRRPVVPLEMALYGHPDSGGIWEQHFDSKVKQFGFNRASEVWNGCYWNPS
jgi:hypothetical protein